MFTHPDASVDYVLCEEEVEIAVVGDHFGNEIID